MTPKKMEQIKCYCGHTTYCDCGPLEEKSAVEWLYETLWKDYEISLPSDVLQKAKEIENKRISKAFDAGLQNGLS